MQVSGTVNDSEITELALYTKQKLTTLYTSSEDQSIMLSTIYYQMSNINNKEMTMTTMYRHDTLKSSGTISKTLNDCNAPVYPNHFCLYESVTIFLHSIPACDRRIGRTCCLQLSHALTSLTVTVKQTVTYQDPSSMKCS